MDQPTKEATPSTTDHAAPSADPSDLRSPSDNAYDIGDPGDTSPARPLPARAQDGRFVKPDDASADPSAPLIAAEPAPTYKHSSLARKIAHDLGMTEDDIGEMKPEVLEGVVYQEQRRRLQEFRDHSIEATLSQRGSAAAPLGGERPPQSAPEPEESIIPKGKYDEDIEGAITKLHDRLKAVERENAQLRAAVGESHRLTVQEQFDRAFAQHSDVFGEGKASEIDQAGQDMIRRQLCYKHVVGQKNPNIEAEVAKFRASVFGAKEPARKAAPAPASDWNDGAVARPTQRRAADGRDGYSKAVASVAAKQTEMAATNGVASNDSDDDFLG